MPRQGPQQRKAIGGALVPLQVLVSDKDNDPFDRLIHERVRLAIVSALSVNPALSFTDLKAVLNTSDGNLSVHARKLEEAGYIACKKTFEGRTPKTVYNITNKGRQALQEYLCHMETLIRTLRKM